MPRPVEKRHVRGTPPCNAFKPTGVPGAELEVVTLTVDEYEAIRLVDYEQMYQEQAAETMGVSRQTVGRILEKARKKVADVLTHGKMLRIEGGEYVTGAMREFLCQLCQHRWQVPHGGGRPPQCPKCGGNQFNRTDAQRGRGRGRGHGRRGRGSPN
ncbi:MAG: DUF134 domain-containing protein [Planctomycetia bacterium]|jgi:predicted DNA-binding protein (UPF0251 family)